MKSLLIAFTLLASVFTKTSFATEKDVDPAVLQSFKNTFTHAKEVGWTTTNNLYRAQFELNGQSINAYFDAEGTLMAIVRNVTLQQLPVTLQAAVKKEHQAAWITELFELSNEEGTQYYVTFENADTKVVLKSSGARWSIYKKTKK